MLAWLGWQREGGRGRGGGSGSARANTQNHCTLNPLKLIAKGDYVAVLPVSGSWQQTGRASAGRQLRNGSQDLEHSAGYATAIATPTPIPTGHGQVIKKPHAERYFPTARGQRQTGKRLGYGNDCNCCREVGKCSVEFLAAWLLGSWLLAPFLPSVCAYLIGAEQLSLHFCKVICKRANTRRSSGEKTESKCRQSAVKDETATAESLQVERCC